MKNLLFILLTFSATIILSETCAQGFDPVLDDDQINDLIGAPCILQVKSQGGVTGTFNGFLKIDNAVKTVKVKLKTGGEESFNAGELKLLRIKREFERDYIVFKPVFLPKMGFDNCRLFQLLNPKFSSYIEVYLSRDSKVTGKAATSKPGYATYILVKDNHYYTVVNESDYQSVFDDLFFACDALSDQFRDDIQFKDFAKHLEVYTRNCN